MVLCILLGFRVTIDANDMASMEPKMENLPCFDEAEGKGSWEGRIQA